MTRWRANPGPGRLVSPSRSSTGLSLDPPRPQRTRWYLRRSAGHSRRGWCFTKWVQDRRGKKGPLTSVDASSHMCGSVDPGLVVASGSPSGVDVGAGLVVRRFAVGSDVGDGEVQVAGAVQGVLGGASKAAGGQDGILVAVLAGQVDRKPPACGRPAVAQAAQWQDLTVVELPAHIGEGASEPRLHAVQLGPVLVGVDGQPLLE